MVIKWRRHTDRERENGKSVPRDEHIQLLRLLTRNKEKIARQKVRKVAEAVSEKQMSMDVIYATTDYL